ncbi:hypothetical protein PACTADRAFT_49610 [Pachysolen tannophilus NRRL Y-2460]|uniref:Uncharacterized protein n=1 Tax=Pachysolen tannophilus NRRL Y-2460 TaxID=669874 RepID=A0A1E4TWU2_PACTA|nr:hypothetical protein PACTADRAFT_49610 [Pachysolen tannophilus NRRL Y-2460]
MSISEEKVTMEGGKKNDILEIYVRMNADLEKDYCFNFKSSETFQSLFKIFSTLPVQLTPSIFYDKYPIGFEVSTAPGFLTENGGLLFSYEADNRKKNYLVKVDNEDILGEKCWPGQLIFPVWQVSNARVFTIASLLFGWLYTDLPDFISPTPGICLTNQISRVLSYLALVLLDNKGLSESLYAETIEIISIPRQCFFFALHLLKVLFVFGFLYSGIFNPYSLNPLDIIGKKADVTKDELLSIGWTGSKKGTIDEYKEYYRELKIKQAGGVVEANKSGLLRRLRRTGVDLGKDEGFNTKIPTTQEEKNALTLEKMRKLNKFKLNYDYISKIESIFQNKISKGSSNVAQDIKLFRKFGPLESNDEIKEIVQQRLERGDGDIEEE